MAKTAMVMESGEGRLAEVKSWPTKVRNFYHDVRTEMKKVTTPNRKEVQATTAVVIVAVFIFGLYFFIIDNIIGTGIDHLFKYFAHR